jgi:hypothetical protein
MGLGRIGRVMASEPLKNNLILLWAGAVLAFGAWKISPWALAALAFLVLAAAISTALGRRRRRLRGYWVEFISPGLLRAGEDEFALVYHEGDHKLWLKGRERRKPHRGTLYLPSSASWSKSVEPWARERRGEILRRVLADRIARRCEVEESKEDRTGREDG